MSLTDTKVRNAKAAQKTQKLFDGNGLYLEISPKGGKWWRLKYRFTGKEKRISLGIYPEVSLKDARNEKDKARKLLASGVDPSAERKARKLRTYQAAVNSFEAVANEWLQKQQHGWSTAHHTKITSMLEKNLFPWLGTRPISEITPPELLSVLRKIESRGALETAKRTKQVSGQVFCYAIATGRAERDPSRDLRDALATPEKTHLAAITEPKAIGPLLLALDGYEGTPTVRAALKLAPLTFVRPGELRNAEWEEINWETNEWRIPAHKMKAKADHIVPLSRQTIEALKEIQPLTGRGKYILPSARSARRPMSDNAVLSAMRSMGIDKDTMSGHGFRAMARTNLDEILEYRVDWIEHQLAHAVKDVHGRAYNRTAHLDKRHEMMQHWADYLDELRAEASTRNVIEHDFRSSRAER